MTPMPVPHPSPLTERSRRLIEELMENEGLSQKRLSIQAEVAFATVNTFLHGDASPTLITIERLFAGLGYEVVLDIRSI